MSEGLEVKIGIYNERPIKLDLPNQIECKIETTDAAIKGQTAASSYKPAILKMVLAFKCHHLLKVEIIIVDTRTIEYIKKI